MDDDDQPIIYTTRIQNNPLSNLTRSVYDVFIFGDPVQTTVTSDADAVQEWIDQTYAIHEETRGAANLLVGLETRGMLPYRFDALILCVDHRCLIFHVLAAENKAPAALRDFLANNNNRFMGVDMINKSSQVQGQLRMGGDLWHGDLNTLVGPGELVEREYGRAVRKPLGTEIWDRLRIAKPNVHSACVDAFLSWDIGRMYRVN